MSSVTAVLFDLDGTLHERDATLIRFLNAQWVLHPPSEFKIAKENFIEQFIELDNHGYTTKKIVYETLSQRFKWHVDFGNCLLDEFHRLFTNHAVPVEGSQALAQRLRAAGILLGIVTNGTSGMQRATITRCGFETFFDAVLISEEEGVRKPDSELFRRALVRLGANANESIFVGDNPEADIAAAKAAGLRAYWRKTKHYSEAPQADLIFSTMEELGDALFERLDA